MVNALQAKVIRRLLVPLIALLLVGSLHRSNVGMAAIAMNQDIALSAAEFGFGAGIVFVGLILGKYPSVLLFQRIGFRRWIAGCLLIAGLCTLAMAAVYSAEQFYAARLVLGFAEAGLTPGVMIYAGQFAGERTRASALALPLLGMPLSLIVGGPLAGWLMSVPLGELAGWRSMFLLEGSLIVVASIFAALYFPADRSSAAWLTREECEWLESHAVARSQKGIRNDWRVLRMPALWLMMLAWFCIASGTYGLIFWLPQLVHDAVQSGTLSVGLISAIPSIGALIGIWLGAHLSDRSGRRIALVMIPCLVAAVSIMGVGLLAAGAVILLALLLTGLFRGAAQGAFWALPSIILPARGLAAGLIAINIAGNLAGGLFPVLLGMIARGPGGMPMACLTIATTLALAAFAALLLRAKVRPAISLPT